MPESGTKRPAVSDASQSCPKTTNWISKHRVTHDYGEQATYIFGIQSRLQWRIPWKCGQRPVWPK